MRAFESPAAGHSRDGPGRNQRRHATAGGHDVLRGRVGLVRRISCSSCAIMAPSVFHRPSVSRDELHAFLEQLYTPRLRQAHLVLWVAVHGLPTPLEKFLAVAEWMEKRGSAAPSMSDRPPGLGHLPAAMLAAITSQHQAVC